MIRRLCKTILAIIVSGVSTLAATSSDYAIPPEPQVPPMVPHLTDEDLDQNKIDDVLDTLVSRYRMHQDLHGVFGIEFDANGRPLADVMVFFQRRITPGDLDTFLNAGGRIDRIYAVLEY